MPISVRQMATYLLMLIATAGVAYAEDARFVPIQTLTPSQLNEVINVNLRQDFGDDSIELAIDQSQLRTDENGKIIAMRVSTLPAMGHISDAGADKMLAERNGPHWLLSKKQNGKPNRVAPQGKWRWDTGIRIKLPAGFNAN
ncbi:hypothetical protein SH528x_002773 [Novipirellula sp. SH528]|uniref:hypothetical protein n=1 Tax=Novipirellula sp. SH528 TaxID=3454466 RepID=UPI003F9FD603